MTVCQKVQNAQAYAEFFASDGSQIVNNRMTAVGRDAIGEVQNRTVVLMRRNTAGNLIDS